MADDALVAPLVDRLVADLKPVPRRTGANAALLVGLAIIELALFSVLCEWREDMPAALHQAAFWWKLISLAVIALLGTAVATLSFDPACSPRRGLRAITGLICAILAAGWLLDASHTGSLSLITRLDWPDGLHCVGNIILLSVPPILGLGLLMRRGAPTDTAGTATAVGAAAAAWGALVFVFSCPFDDPLYVAVWYGIACAAVAGLARLTLPCLTRW